MQENSPAKQSESKRRPEVTVSQAFRDVFIASINKGQFLTAIFGFILAIIFWRLPPDSLYLVVKQIVDSLIAGYLLGYFLFAFALIGWYIHAKRLRTVATLEEKRIGKQKSALQKSAGLGDKVKSHRKR